MCRGGAGCPVRPGPAARRGRRSGFEGLHGLVGVEAAAAAARATCASVRVAAGFPGWPTPQVRIARHPAATGRLGGIELAGARRASTPRTLTGRLGCVV